MNEDRMEVPQRTSRGMSGINIVLGLWVIVSPFVLLFSNNAVAMWNNIATGGAVALLALARLSSPDVGPSWLNIVLGVWLLISPFVLGFMRLNAAMWNNVILGVIVALVAMASSTAPNRISKPRNM